MKPPSFNAVNYSLRPSKTIQRGLVFEGLRLIQDRLDWRKATYIGLGSIWFTDFILAHKILRLNRMVSIEANEVGYRRALFNKPYRFVQVKEGLSYDVLPELFQEPALQKYPSIVWLDYDLALREEMLDELRSLIGKLPNGSVLLTTFDASDGKYGVDPNGILTRLADLFGDDATATLETRDVRKLRLGATLARLVSNVMTDTSRRIARPGGCLPAFRAVYRDKATMVTVGSILPGPEKAAELGKLVQSKGWPANLDAPILAPHLTAKEVAILQAKLPTRAAITRAKIQALGFDLEDEQIAAFCDYYRHYPTFAQIVS